MDKKKIFCMCLHEGHLQNLKKLNYVPVGLGKNNFSEEWLKDNTGENISHKNLNYGEYTFYYWFWKNMLSKISDGTWVGFAGYRYHWSQHNEVKSDDLNKIINRDNYKDHVLKRIPEEWKNHDVILGDEIFIDEFKFSKIIKHAKKKFFLNPRFFIKSNRNIKLHFDIFHGDGNIDKAINLLEDNERDDFRKFVTYNRSFNRENLFFCRSNKLMNEYFASIFKWLEKCEKSFGFDLEGYSMTRIYAFLAERYLSYWFKKYSKPLTWPIFFFDTNKHIVDI